MLSMMHHDHSMNESVVSDVFCIQQKRCREPNFDREKYPYCTKMYKVIPRGE